MRRRIKMLLAGSLSLAVAAGLAVWLVRFPPWTAPVGQRLLGAWEGTAEGGEWGINIKPQPDPGAPGRETAGRVTTSTMHMEFKPDGTYTWKMHSEGDGLWADFSIPKGGAAPPRWEVISARGDRLTVRILLGDVVCDFQGENTFTMKVPDSGKGTGAITFRRSGEPKK